MGNESSKYTQEAVKNCATYVSENYAGKYGLSKRAENPLPVGHKAELSTSKPLDPEESSYHQSIIGVMRWMVEIGRIVITTELSLLSSHLAYPCKGHMEGALHMISNLQ